MDSFETMFRPDLALVKQAGIYSKGLIRQYSIVQGKEWIVFDVPLRPWWPTQGVLRLKPVAEAWLAA